MACRPLASPCPHFRIICQNFGYYVARTCQSLFRAGNTRFKIDVFRRPLERITSFRPQEQPFCQWPQTPLTRHARPCSALGTVWAVYIINTLEGFSRLQQLPYLWRQRPLLVYEPHHLELARLKIPQVIKPLIYRANGFLIESPGLFFPVAG